MVVRHLNYDIKNIRWKRALEGGDIENRCLLDNLKNRGAFENAAIFRCLCVCFPHAKCLRVLRNPLDFTHRQAVGLLEWFVFGQWKQCVQSGEESGIEWPQVCCHLPTVLARNTAI